MNVKHFSARLWAFLFLMTCLPAMAATNEGSVVLDEAGVRNLGIQTVVTEESEFTETAFALGHIDAIPANSGAVSSRISGRLVGLDVTVGDTVSAGQVIAKVESRQPGDPPPIIPLTAPVKGLVMKSDARLGDPVEPDKALMEITDLSEVYAISRVPDHQAGLIKAGTKASIRVPGVGGKVFEGTLLRFGTTADEESGTLDAIFKLENPELLLRPGMRAEFELVVAVRPNVLSVPKVALQGNPATRHVWVKDITVPNAFVKAPVQVGKTSGERVEILNGIFPGDEVVTQGSYSLGFAGGGGGVSLKEALDAAHGHVHNEDGSEITPEQKAAAAKGGGGDGHDHGHEEEKASGLSPRELFFMISTGVLAVLLVLASVMRRKSNNEPQA